MADEPGAEAKGKDLGKASCALGAIAAAATLPLFLLGGFAGTAPPTLATFLNVLSLLAAAGALAMGLAALLLRRGSRGAAGVGVVLGGAMMALHAVAALPSARQPVGERFALLAADANEQARRGDRAATLAALQALVREAVRGADVVPTADLPLEGDAARLFGLAAEAVWEELYGPTRKILADFRGSPAERRVETELRVTRDRIAIIHDQFRRGDCRHVATTFATLEEEVATIIARGKGDHALEKDRLTQAIARLKEQGERLASDSPVRRALESHIAAATRALAADDTTAARREVDAAAARLESDEAP